MIIYLIMYHLLLSWAGRRSPEGGLQDLSWAALLAVVVVAVEEVSEQRLIGRDVCGLAAVHPLRADLREGLAGPAVRPPPVILNTPGGGGRVRTSGGGGTHRTSGCCRGWGVPLWLGLTGLGLTHRTSGFCRAWGVPLWLGLTHRTSGCCRGWGRPLWLGLTHRTSGCCRAWGRPPGEPAAADRAAHSLR